MWILDHKEFRKQELKTWIHLITAIEAARACTPRERHCAREALDADPCELRAVTPRARVRWGKMICEAFSQHFHGGRDQSESNLPVFFVTLCDRRCCTPHDADNINIPDLTRILRRGLRGLSYFGMIEPALYVNLCEGTHVHRKRMVSWHTHLLAWGASRKNMQSRVERLNQDVLLPIADGLPAAHQKRITNGMVGHKLSYMLKTPRKGYRIFKTQVITSNGEVVQRFRQKKSDLRPGEWFTLFRLLRDLYLDQLALAGGEGTDILRRLKRQALRDLHT